MPELAPVALPELPLPQRTRAPKQVDLTPMRIHELALQAWCHRHFQVVDGYPVPVIFATPRDAFSQFTELWKEKEGPFSYLLAAKDEKGTPLYEPYPSNIRYPLLSISRGKWSPRPSQAWSMHINRKAYYPTTATAGDGVSLNQMGQVAQARHPQAWNFSYQMEFYCKRPDTQASFVQDLMNAFPTMTSSTQTWIPVVYPGWFGLRQQYCRMYLDSEIDPVYDLDLSQNEMEYRVSFSVVIEGYNPDLDRTIYPTLWYLCERLPDPVDLSQIYPISGLCEDLRLRGRNPVIGGEDAASGDWPPYGPSYAAPYLLLPSGIGSTVRVGTPTRS